MILLYSCFLFEVFDGVRNSEQLLLNVFITALNDSMLEVGDKIRMYFAYGEVHKKKYQLLLRSGLAVIKSNTKSW